ncbi:hypothetical protein [Collimonas sp. OK607]|uniref:hypothetical protein n=1 Tax=Collimonas sp. OK607 TaxID=1798194 RepID=UPI00147EBB3B|nr:hypothetical protein [Collimonas sp. OK607]
MTTIQSRGERHACYAAARELGAPLFSRADQNQYRQQALATIPVEKTTSRPPHSVIARG